MSKPEQAVAVLFIILFFTFVFGNEICDKTDETWNILTSSGSAPSSGHLLLHNNFIIRKDLLEKQQQPAFQYVPAWKAYEHSVFSGPAPTVPPSAESVVYCRDYDETSVYTSQTEDSETFSPDIPASVNNGASTWEPLSLTERKEYISLNLFHWHLSADFTSPGLAERLSTLLSNIRQHLEAEKLMPDIFVFTGTGTVTFNGAENVPFSYAEVLCRILWEYRFNNEPGIGECKMMKPDSDMPVMRKHNIFWNQNILIISMLPAKYFPAKIFSGYDSCTLDPQGKNPYTSFLFLDIQYTNYFIPLMVFSSLDDSVKDWLVPPVVWEVCVNDLKEVADLLLTKKEAMVIISHINSPYFTYQDFAKLWSAKVRKTEGKIKELNLKNPAAKSFFHHYHPTDPKARRFSAVLSYRLHMSKMKQPARAHMAPDSIYLEFPGTRQKYLKWPGYSPFYPSYTEVRLDRAYLSRMRWPK